MSDNVVMFVDDSETALASTKMATSVLPIEGLQYNSALKALEAIKSGEAVPNLIITDLNMPDMNGFEFLEALREIESVKRVPTLMLTTESRDEMKQRGKKLGLTGWIVKPFNADQLKNAIVRVLRISL
jgi:two-component system chemotaxis response regulator CheY